MTGLDTWRRKFMTGPVLLAALAMVFSTILYKYTLRAWFQQDDFAWLGLRLQVHQPGDLWHALFAPMAQGTIRPFSERAFFLTFSWLFGLHALPYRLLTYATQLAGIALLSAVAWRLTASRAAAFFAPVLWTANIALAEPMTWTSAYNEILCAGCFLLSFYGLLRYVETGNARFNALQWGSFLFGFGVLEINVMYPLIAVLYTMLRARPYVRRALWLLAPAVLFTAIHTAVRTKPKNDVYALYADASMLSTFWAYWKRALGAYAAAGVFADWEFYPLAVTLLLTLALLLFVGWRTWRGDWIPFFCLGWFAIALAPFLPVRNHISDYYLTVPVIGLALLGAWAVAVSLRNGAAYRVATGMAIAVYLACSIPAARKLSKDIFVRSLPVKKLVMGVQAAHQRDPGKIILLEGVDETLFWNGVYDRPFRLTGADQVYLTPEAVDKIPAYPELGNVADYAMPKTKMLRDLAADRVVVYGLEGGNLHDITPAFKALALDSAVPLRVEMGHPAMESMLGGSWYPSEGDFRWMPKSATVHLGMPPGGRGEVRIQGSCAPAQLQAGPLQVTLQVAGQRSGPLQIRDCGQPVRLTFPFSVAPGLREAEVVIEVDRTIRVGADQRDLGLAVQNVEVSARP